VQFDGTVAALEDKIVQRATVAALDALVVGIEGMKVSWILDADIRSFFG
jgi:hypothetical protein